MEAEAEVSFRDVQVLGVPFGDIDIIVEVSYECVIVP